MRLRLFRPQRNQGDTEAAHLVALLRARHKWPCNRTAEKRDELASFKLIELHSVPCQPGAGLQDIELARISQEVAERFYNLLAVGEGGRCLTCLCPRLAA
jgi:hypothetical protein